MFYVAMPDEAQTELLISDALKRGKRVYVPLLGEKYGEMSAAGIASLDELVVGKYGLKMPRRNKIIAVAPDAIDVIVVPGVAFDRSGNRLGMGAGYYDRFFPKTRCDVLLGLAWEFQVVEEVPGEVHDVRMQYLLTEEGFHTCCEGGEGFVNRLKTDGFKSAPVRVRALHHYIQQGSGIFSRS
jgi:5-formyltetrahydrofolate cyclo-ligase